MSGIYDIMYPDDDGIFTGKIDMSDISGTNCYCDDESAGLIRGRLSDEADIRFMDSGNYHYLSYLYMERIKEPFSLVLIDNHTDMQPPGFGDILSCGGWVRYAMERLTHLKKIYLLGMSGEHLSEAEPLPENVSYGTLPDATDELPVYLSIDKDVLSPEFAATDWDQGAMTMDELTETVEKIAAEHRLLGIDICGEKKEAPTSWDIKKNRAANTKLFMALSR